MRKIIVWLLSFFGGEILLFAGSAMISPAWTADNAVFLFAVGVVLLLVALAVHNKPKISQWISGIDEAQDEIGSRLNPHILRIDHRSPNTEGKDGLLLLWVSVVNVGASPTTIHGIGVHVTFREDGKILMDGSEMLKVIHPPEGIVYDDMEYPPEQAIYEVGTKKIPRMGGRAAGYVAATISDEVFDRLVRENGRLVFVVEDAYGKEWAGWVTITGKEAGAKMQHIPGIGAKRIARNGDI